MIETQYPCPVCATKMLAVERHPESKGYVYCDHCEVWRRPSAIHP